MYIYFLFMYLSIFIFIYIYIYIYIYKQINKQINIATQTHVYISSPKCKKKTARRGHEDRVRIKSRG